MKLAEVCRIVGGGTPSKKNKAYYSGNIPWASVRDMNNPILTSTEFRISDEAVRESATNVIPAGEVIISTHVGLGKVCILAQDTAINQDLKAVIPTVDIDRRYLYHWFVSQAPKLVAAGKGATVKGVTVKFVLDLDIPIPSRNSQQSIAKQLSLVLECVKKRQAQLARLDALAKSLFVEMFGDPVENPKGWKLETIGEASSDIRYGTSRPAVEGGTFKYLRMNNITNNGELDLDNLKFIDIPREERDKCLARRGDILFNRTNSAELVGKSCLFKLDEEMVIAGYIIRVRVKPHLLPEYLSAFLNQAPIRTLLSSMAKGAVNQANISAKELQRISVPIPPLSRQNNFAERLELIDKSKFAIRKSLDELNRLYRSLLQQYFG